MNLSTQEQANACYQLRKSLQIELAQMFARPAHDTKLEQLDMAIARYREVFIEEMRLQALAHEERRK